MLFRKDKVEKVLNETRKRAGWPRRAVAEELLRLADSSVLQLEIIDRVAKSVQANLLLVQGEPQLVSDQCSSKFAVDWQAKQRTVLQFGLPGAASICSS